MINVWSWGLDDVEQALYAPGGLRFERHIGDVLLSSRAWRTALK